MLALAVTSCSGGDDDDDAARDDTATSSTEMVKATVDLTVGRADLVSPHAALGPLDEGTKNAVERAVEDLLLITSASPLVEGKAGAGFADLFTPDAGAKASGADRDVFFDEGLPRFGEIVPEEATVEMTGLAGSMGPATALVIAEFRWNVVSSERTTDRVVRAGELQLIPDGDAWKIGAYTLVVTRTVADQTTTTTATTR